MLEQVKTKQRFSGKGNVDAEQQKCKPVESAVRQYQFNVVMKNVTKFCVTQSIVTVNGKFPGPTLYAREGDTVNVTSEITMRERNWPLRENAFRNGHGVRQLRTGWADNHPYQIESDQVPLPNYKTTGSNGRGFNKTMNRGFSRT
ncbi:putative laccase family protein [Heracleum sosnowskyi]|uniref:Laccase family protein n=1 Tax=Heracleum sosnowskyi TaxID=360622 RepID=A0AAD8HHD5_9APIA|nr:putative laccase family protein [Heracleum sosnowskyi]